MRLLPASLSTVAAAVAEILTEHGPLDHDGLAEALDETGLRLGASAEEILDELDESDILPLLVHLDDGRQAWLPSLVADRVFTHRLTEPEVRWGVIAVDPDLAAVILLHEDESYRCLTDGTTLPTAFTDINPELFRERDVDPDALPPGEYALLGREALASIEAEPGDLVSMCPTQDGWRLAQVPDGDVRDDAARLAGTVHAWLDEYGEPGYLLPLMWSLLADTDAFTQPELPVAELLREWGLVQVGDLVAREAFDLTAWLARRRAGYVRSTHDLDPDAAETVVTLLGVLDATDDDGAPGAADDDSTPEVPSAEAVTAFLSVPDVAEAFCVEALGTGAPRAREQNSARAATLVRFVDGLLPGAPSSAAPALHWLLARAHERSSDPLRAEEALRTAVDLGPWPPALRDLARYTGDRGDAAGAAALLRQAGVTRDDRELAVFDHFAAMAATDLGRNKPCWCGSGRKYKVCHLGRETLPLSERAAWLYQKAGTYLHDGPWRYRILAVANQRARYSTSPAAMAEALDDALVADAMLVEDGVFEAFLAERGALLPEDEVLLGQQWLLVDRSVHEVQAVRPGTSLTLRDLRTGDVHTVRERSASRTLKVGDLLCTRVLPAGDTMQIIGAAAPVPLHERDALLDLLDTGPDAVQLVEFLTRRFGPPTLQNTEGEPLVLHQALLRVDDVDRLVEHLDRTFPDARADDDVAAGHGDAGSRTWHEKVGGGRDQIRASVRLDGDTVQVDANSDTRFDRIMATVTAADAGVTVLDHDRRTADELAELRDRFPELFDEPAAGGGRQFGPGADLSDHPEIAEAIAGLMRRYEDQWPDEPLPALGGLTPRQAVDDPTRRDDVVRLLRTWPEPTPDTMSRDRIAGLLGLDLGLH